MRPVLRGDAVEVRADELLGRDLPGAHGGRRFGDAHPADFGGARVVVVIATRAGRAARGTAGRRHRAPPRTPSRVDVRVAGASAAERAGCAGRGSWARRPRVSSDWMDAACSRTWSSWAANVRRSSRVSDRRARRATCSTVSIVTRGMATYYRASMLLCPRCREPLADPPDAFCPRCGAAIDAGPDVSRPADEPLPPPAEAEAPPPGIPWDERERLGFATALVDTTAQVLRSPADFYRRMRPTGGVGSALAYAVIVAYVGFVAKALYDWVFQTVVGRPELGLGPEFERAFAMMPGRGRPVAAAGGRAVPPGGGDLRERGAEPSRPPPARRRAPRLRLHLPCVRVRERGERGRAAASLRVAPGRGLDASC